VTATPSDTGNRFGATQIPLALALILPSGSEATIRGVDRHCCMATRPSHNGVAESATHNRESGAP
jgi:hypothetical protein